MSVIGPVNTRLGPPEPPQLVQESHLLELPTELVLKILKYLSNSQDLRYTGLTCRHLFACILNKPITDYQVLRLKVKSTSIAMGLGKLPELPLGHPIALTQVIGPQLFLDVKSEMDRIKGDWVCQLADLNPKTLITLDKHVTGCPPQFEVVFRLALVYSSLRIEGGQIEIANPNSRLSLVYKYVIDRDPKGALSLLDRIKNSATRELYKVKLAENLIKRGLIPLALTVFEGITDAQQKNAAYETLPLPLAVRGYFENALKLAKLISLNDLRKMAIRNVVGKMIDELIAQKCSVDRAEQIAMSMPTQDDIDWTLSQISQSVLCEEIFDRNRSKIYDLDRSKCLASKIKNSKMRTEAYAKICKFLAGTGQVSEALEFASQCTEGKEITILLSSIAVEMCRKSDVKGGLKLILSMSEEDQIHPLYQMACTRMRQGYLGEALYLMGLIYPPNSEGWREEVFRLFDVALSELHFKDALRLSKIMPAGPLKDQELKRLIDEAIKSLDFESAIEATDEIGDKKKQKREIAKIYTCLQKLDISSSESEPINGQ